MLVALIAVPLLVLSLAGVSLYVPAWGAGLWAGAVALKRVLGSALDSVLPLSGRQADQPGWNSAALHGLLSAITELGVAALYLWNWRDATLAEVLGFGVGAACAEVIYVVGLGFLKREADPAALDAWAQAARRSLWVRFTVPIERLLAGIGHVGSRGLVWIGLQLALPIGVAIVLLAVFLFAVVDGIAVRGLQQKWDWNEPGLTRRLHLYFGAIGISELTLFLFLYSTFRS